MDKNFFILAIGFGGGIILTNIAIGYGKKVYHDYKKKDISNYNQDRSFQNNQIKNQNQQKPN